ncbi:MAG: Nicotinate dehydrogenase FAD-subunit [Firmicutes bacterium ADurb.Bin506]|nr:MAG: Nicotinate dehydrogenase FAD-subunit [Firmicutes bacterium ADurb.Bin506]
MIITGVGEVHRPATLDEALSYMADHPGARPIAGGTDLLVALRARGSGGGAVGGGSAATLVDISGLAELRGIWCERGRLVVGAGTRFTELAESTVVAGAASVLARAAAQVGSVQIRNRATLGGNIVNASPAADSLPALAVHGAVCVLQSARGGERRLGIGGLVTGAYATAARGDELLVKVEIEDCSAWRSSYIKLARRQAMAISRLAVAVLMQFEGHSVQDLRLAVGAAFPVPGRVGAAEEVLRGAAYSRDGARVAGETAADEMVRVSGVRWSTRYKQPVLAALVERAIRQCAAEEGIDSWPE